MSVADLIVRAALVLILIGSTGAITLLLAEQVHLIRTSITKENRHDRTDR